MLLHHGKPARPTTTWGVTPAAVSLHRKGEGYVGKRLSLTVIAEETDPEKIKAIRRRNAPPISEEESKYLVHFHVEGVRPLIGNE